MNIEFPRGNTGAAEGGSVRHASGRDSKSGGIASLGRMMLAERDRWVVWVPVAFATGIGGYFSLAREPGMVSMAVLCLAALALTVLAARRSGVSITLLAAVALSGFVAAKAQTTLTGTRFLVWPSGTVTVTGWVETIERHRSGAFRLVLRIDQISRLREEERPARVRMRSYHVEPDVTVGSPVVMRARLLPPPGPVMPGGFDYGRQLWFEKIGATGFVIGSVARREGAKDADSPIPRWRIAVERLRDRVAERIAAALPGLEGAFAVALVTGHRGQISEIHQEYMRASGLAHLLAISGLHMAMFAGGTFFFLRAVLALYPPWAASLPIKKWAAAGALTAAFAYLVLSGMGIATQRAFIMISVIFLSVLLDRTAISLRNVVIAAMIVLVLSPASLLSPGFQMSFLATASLVAFYEALRLRRQNRPAVAYRELGYARRALRILAIYVWGMIATTTVAGLATAPVGAFHFHRVAVYSHLGNILALPAMSLLVMPGLLGGVAAMPFGLEGPALLLAGKGIGFIVAVAQWVAELPGATRLVATQPISWLILNCLGLIWMCAWRSHVLRALGSIPLVVAAALMFSGGAPHVLIEREVKTIGIRNDQGALSIASGGAGRFSIQQWLRSEANAITPAEARRTKGLRCDTQACAAVLNGAGSPIKLAYVRHRGALWEECARVDILITSFTLARNCRGPSIVIDRRFALRNGAIAIVLSREGPRVITSRAVRGARPWVVERLRGPAER